MPAPPPFQMTPLQFAQSPTLNSQFPALAKSLAGLRLGNIPQQPPAVAPGSAVPGATGPTSVGGPAGSTPLVAPGVQAPNPGANVGQASSPFAGPVQPGQPQPAPSGIMDAIKGMTPPQILSWLQNTSTPNIARTLMPNVSMPGAPAQVPGGVAGTAALTGAGMLPADMTNPYGGQSA